MNTLRLVGMPPRASPRSAYSSTSQLTQFLVADEHIFGGSLLKLYLSLLSLHCSSRYSSTFFSFLQVTRPAQLCSAVPCRAVLRLALFCCIYHSVHTRYHTKYLPGTGTLGTMYTLDHEKVLSELFSAHQVSDAPDGTGHIFFLSFFPRF